MVNPGNHVARSCAGLFEACLAPVLEHRSSPGKELLFALAQILESDLSYSILLLLKFLG